MTVENNVTEGMYKEFLGLGTHVVEISSVNFGVVQQPGKNEGNVKCEVEVVVRETDSENTIVEDDASIMFIRNEAYPIFFGVSVQSLLKAATGSTENLNGATIEKLLENGDLVGRKLRVVNKQVDKGEGKVYTDSKFFELEDQKPLKIKTETGDPENPDLKDIHNAIMAKSAWQQDDVTIVNVKSVSLSKFLDQHKNKERTKLTITGEDETGELVSVNWGDIYDKKKRDFDNKRLTEVIVRLIKLATRTPTSKINENWDELRDMLLSGKMSLEGIKVRRTQTEAISKGGFAYKNKKFDISK